MFRGGTHSAAISVVRPNLAHAINFNPRVAHGQVILFLVLRTFALEPIANGKAYSIHKTLKSADLIMITICEVM